MCNRYCSRATLVYHVVLLQTILAWASSLPTCANGDALQPGAGTTLIQKSKSQFTELMMRLPEEAQDGDLDAGEVPAEVADAAPQGGARLSSLAQTAQAAQTARTARTEQTTQMTELELEEHRTNLAVLSGAAVAVAACVAIAVFLSVSQWIGWKSSSPEAEASAAGGAAPVQVGAPIPEASAPHGLVGIFEANADAHPERTALIDVETKANISYAELASTCRSLATSLGQAGVGGGDVVGLLLEPSCRFVVATMGVMQAGAAWLPLDVKSPGPRIQRLLGRAGARLAFAAEDFAAYLVAPVPVWALGPNGGLLWTPRPPPLPPSGTGAGTPGIGAVFYTSGSTGEPKAVMYGTETLCHGALTFGKLCQAGSGSVFLVKTPTIWAVTEYEVFTPLAVGACAVVDAKAQRDPIRLAETIRANSVSVLVTSAPVLQLLADERLPSLRHAVNVGAAMPVEVCTAVQSAFGPSLSIHNLYGCTETPCLSWTNDPFGPPPSTTLVPAGSPQPGVEVHVLDPQGQPAAIGCAGEVYIGGPFVSRGYLDDENLTKERFLPSPSSKSFIYRTGDVGRWVHDPRGLVVLQIEGRVDRQLNIRGVRVAPEEVEGVLSQAPGVKEVALVVVGSDGSERLVACISGDAPDLTKSVARHSSSHLPSHMRPAGLILLDALPRLGNGKVDLTSLTERASEELKGSVPEEVEAVDSLGRMRKVKRQVQHDLQVMSAVRAVATVGVILFHWYWQHWVDYTHHDGIIVPSLYGEWKNQGSRWFRVLIKGSIGVMPWTMPAFVTMSGYTDSADGMKSKFTENVVGLLLYFACYYPMPYIFMWVLQSPMENRHAPLEFWLGNHRWYLVYYLLCNVLHSWVFLPLRTAVEHSSPRVRKLAPVAMLIVVCVLCLQLLPALPLRGMCGTPPVTSDTMKIAFWLLPRIFFHKKWLECTLVLPAQLHLFIVYTVAWWFGPSLVKHVREAPAGRWLDLLGAALPLSLFFMIISCYLLIFPVEAPTDLYRHWLGVICCYLVIWATASLSNKRWFPLAVLSWFGRCSLATYVFHCYMIIRVTHGQSMTFFRFRDQVIIPAPEEIVAVMGHWPGSDIAKVCVLVTYALLYMATFGQLFQHLLLLIPALGSAAATLVTSTWFLARRACASASGPGGAFSSSRLGPASPAWQRLCSQFLDAGGVICLDGGTGSELERRATKCGQDNEAVNHSGWSCLQWRTHPDLLRDVHASYLQQGASVVISNSYATNRHIMKAAGFEDLTEEGTLSAVRLACEARDGFRQQTGALSEEPLLVAGSMSCHPPGMAHGAGIDKGQWPPKEVESAAYHEQAKLLAKGGVDIIFVEMVWEWKDHGVLAAQGACAAGLPVALCLSVFDAASCEDGMPQLHDGTLVEELAREVAQGDEWRNVVALCVHHTKLPLVLPCLLAIRKGGWTGVVGAYPDHGTFEMPHWRYEPLEANKILNYTEEWVQKANCQMIGGCCGIGPETIKEIGKWCGSYNARCGCAPSTSRTCSTAAASSAPPSECGDRPPPEAGPLPVLVLGAGLSGLAAARECQKRGYSFLLVDKQQSLGGCWTSFGNKTSKLQSDSGSYDVEMDQPHSLSSYPSKDELMAYVREWYGRNNLGQSAFFGTELLSVVPDSNGMSYTACIAGGSSQRSLRVRALLAAPGRLRQPVRKTLEGEDVFQGALSYGICDDFPSVPLQGKEVVVLGHGSFSIESMRTCLEKGAAKVTLLCRTRNLVLPRAVRLAISRAPSREPFPVKRVLDLCGPAYKLLGMDCRSLSTVSVSRDGTASLRQTQPPVSDLYFLAQCCGSLEVVVDTVSHLTATAVCTVSTQRHVAASALFKCFGFEAADPHFDKVLGLEQMVGMWVNGDPGRFVLQEPTGKVSFTAWPVPYANPHFVYLFYFFRALQDHSFLGDLQSQLPVSSTAAYDGGHAHESFRVLFHSLNDSGLQELGAVQDRPAHRARKAHPWPKFVEEQRAEWEAYSRAMAARGAPSYPYSAGDFEKLEERSARAEEEGQVAEAGGGGKQGGVEVKDLRTAVGR